MRAVWIGVAGGMGSATRYGLDLWISRRTRGAFPWGTFVVNVSGAFLLGLVVGLLAQRLTVSPTVRAALTVGFLGGYTTFSTLALETVRLGEDGAPALALLNVAGSLVAGVLAAWVGLTAGRAL